ncbi:ChrR family anti-sigma-E factor [Chelatococcus reniformis]|uniref:Anti-sigma-E factor ChrR n=1 Tax=Chelatococcus reniformis TaxID=1494448 RepID=A0A916UP45_9HYPH|nr:ChrR family anti-sigma-E factor [Chelatococcus reniformis]GGC81347.1 anti-sigma-E factor ChrR [Chelatococcus reniformis]
MTISHHPSDETLLRFAAGRLPSGPAFVVATHVSGCAACRDRVAAFETVGGALLEEMPPTPLAPEALARVLAAIDGPPRPRPGERRRPEPPLLPDGHALPAPLLVCNLGPWRWFGAGIRVSRVTIPGDPAARLNLLRVGANRKLPEHGHAGLELTQVLSGSFSDRLGHYRPGDLAEVDSAVDHQPVADPDGECICLAALEGEMRLGGLLGRLLQPLIRF